MKIKLLKLLFISGLSMGLLGGCSGQEVVPNNATQTGVVTGALAGSVIGYNTKGNHRGQRALVGGLLGAAAGGVIGNAVDNQNTTPQQAGGWQ